MARNSDKEENPNSSLLPLEGNQVEQPNDDSYAQLLEAAKNRIREAQYAALKAVNTELIEMYWDLGQLITEKQEQYGWGENVVRRLSKDLRVELEGMSGLSAQNLWRMRQFYLTYKDSENLSAMLREIGWSQHLEILRCRPNMSEGVTRGKVVNICSNFSNFCFIENTGFIPLQIKCRF